ncbi:MAG: hypothetical protein QOF76_1489 [Solirubrobacteraceae bacterium]|jgi:hypothetical protein|nr:hypothetical protein [Solirubrobacteraceae bacterium]
MPDDAWRAPEGWKQVARAGAEMAGTTAIDAQLAQAMALRERMGAGYEATVRNLLAMALQLGHVTQAEHDERLAAALAEPEDEDPT